MVQPKQQHYAIVGGGMLGLTLALRLTEAGHKVTILEGASELGGLASAWQVGDVVWDRHYHVTLLSDTAIRNVLNQLGIDKDMQWVETKTGFYTDGKLVSMSNTLEFLKFPPLGLLGKFRLGWTIFHASRIKNWKALEKVSVADWLKKLSGKKTFEKIWLPLLRAKLGDNYKLASAAFIWSTIQRMYAARRTGLKKEMFGYMPGGYARTLEKFAQFLEEKGVRIELNSRIERVENNGDGVVVETADGKVQKFDNAVLTIPSAVAAKVCPSLTNEEKMKLNCVQYQGIICASVLLKNSLADYYVTNITDEVPFTAVIEMSALVDKEEHFGGNALVYLPKYVGSDDEAFKLSDEELKESFISTLEKMYTHFKREDVISFKVSRVRYVFPIPTIGYSEKLPSMKTSVPNVFIVNSAHIINGTLNVNETVQLAERGARMLLNESKLFKWETKNGADSKLQLQKSKLETV